MPKVPLKFPVGGLDENPNFAQQDQATSPALSNVRTHDAILGRARGGRREGQSKFISSAINGAAAIQILEKVVRPVTEVLTGISKFGMAHEHDVAPGDATTHTIRRIADNSVVRNYISGTAGFTGGYDIAADAAGNFYLTFNENNVWTGNDGHNASLVKINAAGTVQWHLDLGNGINVLFVAYDKVRNRLLVTGRATTTWEGSAGVIADTWAINAETGAILWNIRTSSSPNTNGCAIDSSGRYYLAANSGGDTVLRLDPLNGNVVAGYDTGASDATFITINSDDEILTGQGTFTAIWEGNDATNKNIFLLDKDLALVTAFLFQSTAALNFDISADILPNGGNIVVGAHSGAGIGDTVEVFTRASVSVWSFDAGDAGGGGFGNLAHVIWDQDGDVWVFTDRNSSWTGAGGATRSLWRIDGITGTVNISEEVTDTARSLKSLTTDTSLTTRETSLILIAGGTVKRLLNGILITPTSGVDAMTAVPYLIQVAALAGKVFMVDGTDAKYFDLSDDSVKDWAGDVTAGTLPGAAGGSAVMRLITRYRGRIVMAGSLLDPSNWFMSKVQDPFDFDFTPAVPTAITAVAGNNSETGLIGDIITAIIPFADDALLFGGDSTIWQMSGDPAAGGSIDLISDDTGIAWDAWAKDPDGLLYFLGVDGIYRMEIGKLPENITLNRLDRRFEAIDLTQKRVVLEWDFLRKGLVVVIGTIDPSIAVEAFFYSKRDDSWTPDTYTTAIAPLALLGYDAEKADDKTFLLGCRDGFVRKVDASAADDDGNTISSSVRFAPIGTRKGTDVRLTGIEIEMGENSGPVNLKVYSGQTAEQCVASTQVRFKRVLTAGHNEIRLIRVTAPWVQIELSQTNGNTRWAFESGLAIVAEGGMIRSRRR